MEKISTGGATRRCGRAGIVLLWLSAALFAANAAGAEDASAFGFDDVVDMARTLAAEPYVEPENATASLNASTAREHWDKIAFRSEEALWADDGLPFAIALHHPGFVYSNPVTLAIVENGIPKPLAFDANFFEYPTAETREQAAKTVTGYAGFSLRHRYDSEHGPDEHRTMDEVASFLGATYFQSRGRQSRFGVFARALALDTALPDGEEFPRFNRFWLVKPEADDESFTLYALADSSRMTGAVRCVVTPGSATVMDLSVRLFPRANAKAPGKIGLAPLTSMFLHSETATSRRGDYRPEVHNSDGLLHVSADHQWSWIPLDNPARLTVNRYQLENPRGFGLMQRDDNFDHYQDLDARFDRRPSLWVEPKGEWGAGHVELVEIPGSEDFHANIIAFWVPAAAPEATSDTPGAPLYSLDYRLFWLPPGVTPHQLGRVVATRMHRPAEGNVVEFLVDFEGERLNTLPADTGLASVLETPEQIPVIEKKLVKNEATSGWRLRFKVRVPAREGILGGLFSGRDGGGGLRLKALLKQGENLPDALTETWTLDVQPLQ